MDLDWFGSSLRQHRKYFYVASSELSLTPPYVLSYNLLQLLVNEW